MMNLRTFIWIIFIFLLVSQSACAADKTFQGKVIDADTLKPIEGAVVVAIWRKTRAGIGAGADTRFKDAKESLTDKNGEWSITGPKGDEDKVVPTLLHFVGVYMTRKPEIIYYKPGYRSTIRGGLTAYPYIVKEHNLEGIVLVRVGETKEERKEFKKKYPVGVPFIPIKEPEKKLRNLDFSFEYPENVKVVGRKKGMKVPYRVIGLRKAKTREERLDAMRFTAPGKLPLAHKMQWEERERLFGADRKKK